ncbi:hypothetical protein B0T12DRAFT_61216 [Alternaria alternata]|jgi:hypothetical protein|nr:hypothetical protein B0T12DRAFT_61216 [Alternaria alternata]
MFMLYLLLLPELIRGTTLARLLHARTTRTMLRVSLPTFYTTSRLKGKKKHERKKTVLEINACISTTVGKGKSSIYTYSLSTVAHFAPVTLCSLALVVQPLSLVKN